MQNINPKTSLVHSVGPEVTFKNSGATLIEQGMEVVISGDRTVVVRAAADADVFPIGVAMLNGAQNDDVTVHTVFSKVIKGINDSGGAVTAGTFVKPVGTLVASGNQLPKLPNYDVVAEGEFALGIVLVGGDDEAEIEIGVLNFPYQPPVVPEP